MPDPVGALVTRWASDPYALGSYSYLSKEASPQDRLALGQADPSGRLYFAGEAIDPNNPATVHGALLSGRKTAGDILQNGNDKIIIVGAGAAGLAAARDLTDAGKKVVVVEARERIGGRIWTNDTLGVPIDLGASWIHGVDGNPLSKLADDGNIARLSTDYENYLARDASGRRVSWQNIPDGFEDIVTIEHEYAASIDTLSDMAEAEYAPFGGGDVVFPNGYLDVLRTLIADIDIRLGTPIDRISIEDSRARALSGDEWFDADAVLVTVPLGVLKSGHIQFDPPLGAERQTAINRLGMGLLNKVSLRFEDVFWDEDVEFMGYVGEPLGYFAEWLNMAKYIGEPILIGFNAADQARDLEQKSDAEIVDAAMAVLRNMYS
ncbi:MAG: FAD-dependent oxidoreductase [Pseudomonadota bacterium]